MSATVVWMDHQHAKLFHLTPGHMESKEIKHKGHDHHSHNHKEDAHNHSAFFHELIPALNSSTEILLMGPGTAKVEFKHHLESHGHAAVAKKIVGVETVDHPSENKILELARKFFKTRDLFAHPIR